MSDLKKKAIMLGVAILLLASVLLYMSFGWYTKMTGAGNLEFQTAKWEITANHQVDQFKVNVYSYNSLNSNYAAPGSWGIIPIELKAEFADTDVTYTVTMDKSTMSPEFQQRLYFYYYTGQGTDPKGKSLPTAEQLTLLVSAGENRTVIQGTVPYGKTSTAYIYWHWLYDYDEWLKENSPVEKDVVDILNQLYDDNSLNMEVLYNPATCASAFKTENLGPAETYYTKGPYAFEYDKTKWASEVEKPTLYLKENGEYKKAKNLGATLDEDKTYYTLAEYKLYEGGANPGDPIYICRNGKYYLTEYRTENTIFVKTDPDTKEPVYYALSDAQRKKLVAFRQSMIANTQNTYDDFDTFFKDYYQDYQAAVNKFDAFDTAVGLSPSYYSAQMGATVLVTGEEVEPKSPEAVK